MITGVAETIDSFFIGRGAIASITFALLFFFGFWLTVRGRIAGPLVVAVMSALEIAMFPGLTRTTTIDWIVQVFIVVISAIGIAATAAVLLERRRSTRATTTTT